MIMPKDNQTLPTDLISATEGAKLAGKSKPTIRSWCRKGKITPYKLDPSNHSSPLMISLDELKTFLAINGTITHPNNNGRPSDLSASLQEKDKLIEQLQNELSIIQQREALTSQRISDLQMFTNTLQKLIETRDGDVLAWKDQFKRVSASLSQLQQEHNSLLRWITQPFWKRWRSNSVLLDNKQ